jgi:hypothetical protein
MREGSSFEFAPVYVLHVARERQDRVDECPDAQRNEDEETDDEEDGADAQGQLRECSARGADVEAPKSEPAEEQL